MKSILSILILAGSCFGQVTANNFPGADICAKIMAAAASIPAGGHIYVNAGNYPACAASSSNPPYAIVFASQYTLEGYGWYNNAATAPTTINFQPNVAAILITGGSVTVLNMNLQGSDTTQGTNPGVTIKGISSSLAFMRIGGFGGSGVLFAGNSPYNADSWSMYKVQLANNFGDAATWACPASDNNQGVATLVQATANRGYGFNLQCGGNNVFNSPLAQANGLNDYNVYSSYNIFLNVWCETGQGSTFYINASGAFAALGNRVTFQNGGLCDSVQNNGPTATGNFFIYPGPDGWIGQSDTWFLGQPGSANNKSYRASVNEAGPGQFNIFDYTDIQQVLTYDPVAKSMTFGSPYGAPLPQDPPNPQASWTWYNTTLGHFRCALGNPVTVVNCP